ncbi:hypothetical protein APSETT444_002540 [Aspergillus pseudonomiae]
MALSLSSNLAHAPPINGLYSFVINPFIYAIFGSSPLLIVGPEAAGSLLTGTIVKSSVGPGPSGEDDEAANAMVVGIATAMAGAMILIAGLTRLGFLDNVLSRPFLRGFITAIGFVIFVDQLIPEVGLTDLAKEVGVSHGTTVDKLVFLIRNIGDCHALTTAVAFGSFAIIMVFSLIEECPHDLAFFIRLRGWTELVLMLLIFVSTIFYSLELGIALGIGLSILILIRHSTQPRIQILGKIAGTTDRFENAELHPESVELIEGALIVKIPEPLTFANTGELKNRLRRLELYGSSRAHPSLPPTRTPEHNKNIIFDVHGVTSIDGSGTQVLYEIVDGYADQGVSVFFCRVATRNVFRMFERSGIVERCGGITHFVHGVDEALRLAESEDQIDI